MIPESALPDMTVEAPIIDCHAHIFHRGMPFREDAWIRPDYDYTVDRYLADLDAHGIAFGVVTAASLYGDYNDYTLAALATHKRLRATVMLDPATRLDELRRLRDLGVVGVRLQWKTDSHLPDLDGYLWSKFFNRLADCGMHAELNCGAAHLARVLPVLRRRPMQVVVDHFGLLRSPDGTAGDGFAELIRSIDAGRTWAKVSAGFRIDPTVRRDGFDRLFASAGTERLLWGSDAPFVGMEDQSSYARSIEIFREVAPEPKVRRAISDTGLRFYLF